MKQLDKSIKHWKKLAKSHNTLQAHYALGALEILEEVREIRDGYSEEAKDLWRGRAHELVMTGYQYTKDFVSVLNSVGNVIASPPR